MGSLAPTYSSLLWLPVAGIVFLLPGWMLARRLGAPAPLLAGFLGSAAILFNLVLLLDAVHLPLHAGTVGIGLGLATLAFRRRPAAKDIASPASARPGARLTRTDWFWLFPAVLALGSIAVRTVVDPLSGYDNGFRWDYLARLFLAQQSMISYPPITATHFEYYGWCDGIPPLAPLLNFWIYAVTGSIAPALVALRIIGETLLLGTVVFRYSRLLWGANSGGPAVAALSASALAIWSLAMSQETGLTAVSLVAMLYFLELHQQEPRPSLLFWAGLAAAVGALARDYALAYPLLGLGVLLARRQPLRRIAIFAVTAAVVAAPWYVRNWIRTGNPLYPHTLGGLFPGNPVHDEFMRYIAEYWSLTAPQNTSSVVPLYLTVLAGALLALGGGGVARAGWRAAGPVAGIVLISALWLWSVSQVAAGWVYSARILLPALALAAVLAGWIGTLRRSWRVTALLVLSLAGADAARRAWLLPGFPLERPGWSFAPWREARAVIDSITAVNPTWKILAREAAGRKVVVDHPSHHALLTMNEGNAVPFFSPALASTFGNFRSLEVSLEQMRAARIRFVTLSWNSILTQRMIQSHPFWSEFCRRYEPNARVAYLSIYDLDRLTPAKSPRPSGPPETAPGS